MFSPFLKMMISEDLCKDNHQLLLLRRDFLVISEDLCKDNQELRLLRRAGCPPRSVLGGTKKLYMMINLVLRIHGGGQPGDSQAL